MSSRASVSVGAGKAAEPVRSVIVPLPETLGRKLLLFQQSDPLKHWWSLGEMRMCKRCEVDFHGKRHQADGGRGVRWCISTARRAGCGEDVGGLGVSGAALVRRWPPGTPSGDFGSAIDSHGGVLALFRRKRKMPRCPSSPCMKSARIMGRKGAEERFVWRAGGIGLSACWGRMGAEKTTLLGIVLDVLGRRTLAGSNGLMGEIRAAARPGDRSAAGDTEFLPVPGCGRQPDDQCPNQTAWRRRS